MGLAPTRRRRPRPPHLVARNAEIIRRFTEGDSRAALALRYGRTVATIDKILYQARLAGTSIPDGRGRAPRRAEP